jgi:hypothetical protein
VLSTQQVNTLVAAEGSVTPTEPIGMTWLSVDSWLLLTSYNSDRLHLIYGSCNAPTAEGLHCDEVSLNAVAGSGSWGSTDAVGTNANFDQPFG